MSEQIGEYSVIRPLGQGGMAEVFVVEKIGIAGFKKQLCLKRIRRDHADDIEYVIAFETEARIISRLQNSNIVHVSDFFKHGNDLCLVMELIDGMDLYNIIHTLKPLKAVQLRLDFAVYVLQSLLLALKHAHNLNVDGEIIKVIHRDISPQNLLISTEGVVKLTDFGVAKVTGKLLSKETRTGVIKGKLCYMPPEQMRGGKSPMGPEVDLFAAGVVFWEMLADDRLFKATMEHQVMANVMNFEKAPIPNIHPKIQRYIDKILSPDAANRFHSAEEALEALDRLCILPCTPSYAGQLVTELMAVKKMRRENALKAEASQHTASKRNQTKIDPARYEQTKDDKVERRETYNDPTRTEQELSGSGMSPPTFTGVGRVRKSPTAIVAVAAVLVTASILLGVWLMIKPKEAEVTEINKQETATVFEKPNPPTDRELPSIKEPEKQHEPAAADYIEPMPTPSKAIKTIPVQSDATRNDAKKPKRLNKPKRILPEDKLAPFVLKESE